jgi:hypothetical protein
MNKFTTVYHDAGEREIRAVVLYANASKLYIDSEHTTEVGHDDALDLCEKGFLRVFDTDTFYAVTSFKEADGTLTVGYGASKTATVTSPLQ